jgi:hypothetical protein
MFETVKKILTFPERFAGYISAYFSGKTEERRRHESRVSRIFNALLTAGVIVLVAFLLGGGAYLVIYRPSFLVAGQGPLGAAFIYRGNSLEETFLEGMFVSILYIFSLAGMYLIYRSTRYYHSPRTMWMIFVLGFCLLAFGSILIYQASVWKMR